MVKNRYNGKSIKRLLFFVLIINIAVYVPFFLSYNTVEISYYNSNDLTPSYWNLIDSPIYIDDMSHNDNWDTITSENFWCTGKSTAIEPYIIQDVIVSSTYSDCITILHSEVYFIITNCIIFSSQKELGSGIFLQSVKNAYITYSQISNCDSMGITMGECTNVVVYQNTIFGNGWKGIDLFKGVTCEILENIVYNNSAVGISIFQSNSTKIIDNEIYTHYIAGIDGGFCAGSEIGNNNIHNNNKGIYMHKSNYNTISQNTITDNAKYGIILRYNSDYNTISDNILSNNKYCIAIGSSCKNNEIFNNGVCDFYTIAESEGGDGRGDDEADDNGNSDENTNLSIPGYNYLLLVGIISIFSLVIYVTKNLKFRLKRETQIIR